MNENQDTKNNNDAGVMGVANNSIIQSYYTHERPSKINALKIFENLWSSNIPGYGFGHAGLFEDPRIDFFIEECGGLSGKKVLELGPLEGAHTYMMSQAGASITSIESNTISYLKCLIVKEIFGIHADFNFGDFRPFLKDCTQRYDLVVASGVLYHMIDPVGLLLDMMKVSDKIGIWTHYYDSEIVNQREELSRKLLAEPAYIKVDSLMVELYKQSYLEALGWGGFCGGSEVISYWLTKVGLLDLFRMNGYEIKIKDDDKYHPNGPAITFFARKGQR